MTARVDKLARRGIVAFEVDGVLGRLTKKQSADAALARELPSMVELAAVVAAHIRHRVRDERRPASSHTAYSTRGRRAIAKKVQRHGFKPRYPSSRSIPRRGLAMMTGSMWDNVEAVARGRGAAVIQFRGSSAGTAVTPARPLGGLSFPVRSAYDVTVKNQTKANQLFRKLGLHVLEPTDQELIAIGDVFGNASARAFVSFFGGELSRRVRTSGADRNLSGKLRAILRGFKG